MTSGDLCSRFDHVQPMTKFCPVCPTPRGREEELSLEHRSENRGVTTKKRQGGRPALPRVGPKSLDRCASVSVDLSAARGGGNTHPCKTADATTLQVASFTAGQSARGLRRLGSFGSGLVLW